MAFVKIYNEPGRLKFNVDNSIFYRNKDGLTAETSESNLVIRENGIIFLNKPFYIFLEPAYNSDHHSVRELLDIINGYIGVPATPGGDVDKHYTHVQGVPNVQWNITHNLEKKPSVTVVDSADTDVMGEIIYIDNNNVQLNFSAAFSGKAYLN